MESQIQYNIGDVVTDAYLIGMIADVKRVQGSRAVYDISVGGTIIAGIITHKGVAYFGSCDKNFYAVDIATGKELWRFSTKDIIIVRCRIYNDRIYFSSYDRNCYCLSLDGRLIWKFTAKGKLTTMPCIKNDRIYFGSFDKHLYCLTTDGKLVWDMKMNDAISSNISVHRGIVYFGSFDNNFYAVKADGSGITWKFSCNGDVGAPEVYINKLYFGSFDQNFYCLDLKGNLVWKFTANGPVPIMEPLVKNGIAYALSWDKHMYALDSETGKLLWKFETNDMCATIAREDNGIVYFGSADGNLYALDKKTGKRVWNFQTKGPIVSPVGIWKDIVLFGGWDCNLYCLDNKGNLIWRFPTALSYVSTIDMSEPEFKLVSEVIIPEDDKKEKKQVEETINPGYIAMETQYGDFDITYTGQELSKNPFEKKKRVYR
ncbi:MAG: PQQ-binding-like beta-propeller repeat protein [Candidatus Aenigmarchaeota archaeon]|nr:PQQ-binding-like beta-propeller repeat protein [Candidatus Aenigmarchaeota archaeon]